MVLNVHRNDKAYQGLGKGVGEGAMDGGGACIPIATLSPPE